MDKKVLAKERNEAVKLKSLLKQASYLFQKGNEWECQSPDNYRLKQENQEKVKINLLDTLPCFLPQLKRNSNKRNFRMISPLLIFIRESGHFQDSLRCWRKSEKKLSMVGHKRVKQAWYEKKCNRWAQRIGVIRPLRIRLYLRIWKFIKLNSSNKEINEIFWKSWKKIACKTIICCREKINHLNI